MFRWYERCTLVEARTSCGAPTWGTHEALSALERAGLRKLFRIGCGVRTGTSPGDEAPCERWPENLRCLDTVMHAARRLYDTVGTAVRMREFPFIIGGDHSCSIGSLAAMGEACGVENLAVVYVDAHTDINTDKTSVSGYIHGMDLAAACGLCCEELDVGEEKVHLLGENLHFIGARSIDPPEYGIVEQVGAHLHTAQEVRERGLDAVLADILPALEGKLVHISFDVDVLDPSEFTATGYNIPDGLTVAQVDQILEAVIEGADVASFECVEYNPSLDPEKKDLKTLMGILQKIIHKIEGAEP